MSKIIKYKDKIIESGKDKAADLLQKKVTQKFMVRPKAVNT